MLPPRIEYLAESIRTLRKKLDRRIGETRILNIARLEVACWVLDNESLPMSEENLSMVLGNEAHDVRVTIGALYPALGNLPLGKRLTAAAKKLRTGRVAA